MATGFHLSTIGMSVRNYLAIAGPQPVESIATKLRELYHAGIDAGEVRAALDELLVRKLVEERGPGTFAAMTNEVFRQRNRPLPTDADCDSTAWEGWH